MPEKCLCCNKEKIVDKCCPIHNDIICLECSLKRHKDDKDRIVIPLQPKAIKSIFLYK